MDRKTRIEELTKFAITKEFTWSPNGLGVASTRITVRQSLVLDRLDRSAISAVLQDAYRGESKEGSDEEIPYIMRHRMSAFADVLSRTTLVKSPLIEKWPNVYDSDGDIYDAFWLFCGLPDDLVVKWDGALKAVNDVPLAEAETTEGKKEST